MKGFLIGLGIVLILSLSVVGWYISVVNKEVSLRNRFEAQEMVIEGFYDKMFKVLKQKAGVTEEYKESFKEIYVPLIEGRYSQGDGTLMKWVTESNPQFDASLYKDLMSSIEGQRDGFFIEQQKIIDIQRTHKDLTHRLPSSLVVGGVDPLLYTVISSTAAKKVMETRVEDNIELFDKE